MITIFCIRPKAFNVGNDVIFLGMQHFLNKAFGDDVNLISLPATSQYESVAKAGLTPKTIYEINQYGHGVIVGGGNLYENGELDVNLEALDTLEVPLFLFSLSRGRIYNRKYNLVDRTDAMPMKVISALNKKANFSLARDNATQAYLQSIGCKNSVLGGCPTLFINKISERLPKLSPGKKNGVLISIRNPALMSIPLSKQSDVRNDILDIITFLRREGHQDIKLLCHDHRDISFASTFPGVEYIYTGDVYAFLALLRSCELNITYRLHSVLPCLSFNTPVIKISYDERAMSLLETIGLDEWNINMICTKNVVEHVIDRYNRIDELNLIKCAAKPRWTALEQVMNNTFKKFAKETKSYKESVE